MSRISRAATSRAPMSAACLVWLTASTALAQTAPPPPAPKPADTVADVVVVGERPAVKSAIDRKVYTVSRDLAADGGSVSDVLRNLPSVNVDINGEVALRGSTSVQVLIDGLPATQFLPQTRAQALMQMQASTVETIEIMTNPSAEFAPDGAGGIINIVMKKVRKPGRSGSVQARAGDDGRQGFSALLGYKDGPLSVSSNLGLSHDARGQTSRTGLIRIDPTSGAPTEIAEAGSADYAVTILNLSLGLDYDRTPRDRLSISGMLIGNDGLRHTMSASRTTLGGVLLGDYTVTGAEPYRYVVAQGSATWRHSFAETGRLFTLSARHSEVEDDHKTRLTYVFSTPTPMRAEQRNTYSSNGGDTVQLAYTDPMADGGTLKAGYDYRKERVLADFYGALVQPGGGLLPLTDVNNRFAYEQTNHQAWTTWQKPIGKLTALAGLRLERAEIEYEQVVGAIGGGSDYVDLHPSLHLQYAATEARKFTLSYSHRVSRPSVYQLNPFVRVTDPFNASAGNPDLRPQETHSMELDFEQRLERGTLGASLYLRKNYNTIGGYDRFLSPTVVLHTFENQGDSTTGGLELDATGRLDHGLSLHINANLAYNELQSASGAGGGTRSAWGYTLRGNLDWRASDLDLFQLTGSYGGEQPTAQGYRLPTGGLNLGYRRKLRPDLTVTATISDLFESQRGTQIYDAPLIVGRSDSFSAGRAFTVVLTRQLGGKPAPDASFEYVN